MKPVASLADKIGLYEPPAPPIIPAPTIINAPPVPVMPTPDMDAQKKARQAVLSRMYQRRGRASTIMSDVSAGVETLG